jgi:lipopolysaccharide export system permease protein
LGIWLSSAIILPLGLFLTWKATTDAPLLDSESWAHFFQKLDVLMFWKKKPTNEPDSQ